MRGGPEAVFCDFGPVFGLIFGFFSSQKHLFFTVFFLCIFVFCRSLTAILKDGKTIVNTSVLCHPVAKNLANTTVLKRWVKRHCKLRCFWPPDLQKHRYLQWFLPPKAQKHCKIRHVCRFFPCFNLFHVSNLVGPSRHAYIYFYIYIYIYMYVCIRVYVCLCCCVMLFLNLRL